MSQSDLARRMGVAPITVSQWVNDKRSPSVQSCYLIGDALDMPVSYVMQAAGLPTEEEVVTDNELAERVDIMFRKLSPEGQQAVADFVEWQRGREREGTG